MEDIEPAGTARKLIGRKVEWRLHFEDKRYQARPNRAESQERRCDYFDVYATQDDGREVGYLTRKVGRDGIEWRGKIDGHHVQLYRNPEHCAAEDREVFDIYHAAHCQGWRNNCEGHEHDEEVDAPKEEAA